MGYIACITIQVHLSSLSLHPFCFPFESLSSLMFWPNGSDWKIVSSHLFYPPCISKACWRVFISSKNCLLFRSSPKYRCCCWCRLSNPSAKASSDNLFNISGVDKCCQPFKHLMSRWCMSCLSGFLFGFLFDSISFFLIYFFTKYFMIFLKHHI